MALACVHVWIPELLSSEAKAEARRSSLSTPIQFQSSTNGLGHKSGDTINFVSHTRHSKRIGLLIQPSACAKADLLITASADSPQWRPNNIKHRNNEADFMSCQGWKETESEFTDKCISGQVELPLGREDGREAENATCFNLSKQRCCIAFFLSPLSPSAPGGERCWLFALLLSSGRQNGLLGNLSGQVEERSAASSVTVFPPLVFTFCLFAEWETWTPPSFSFYLLSFFPPLCLLSSVFLRTPHAVFVCYYVPLFILEY